MFRPPLLHRLDLIYFVFAQWLNYKAYLKLMKHVLVRSLGACTEANRFYKCIVWDRRMLTGWIRAKSYGGRSSVWTNMGGRLSWLNALSVPSIAKAAARFRRIWSRALAWTVSWRIPTLTVSWYPEPPSRWTTCRQIKLYLRRCSNRSRRSADRWRLFGDRFEIASHESQSSRDSDGHGALSHRSYLESMNRQSGNGQRRWLHSVSIDNAFHESLNFTNRIWIWIVISPSWRS